MTQKNNSPKPHVLLPSFGELILYPAISFFFLLLLAYNRIADYHGLQLDTVDISAEIASFQEKIHRDILPELATAMAWAAIGLAVYFLVWLIVDSSSRATQANRRLHRFIYPDKESRHTFMLTIFGQLAIRAASILMLIIWCVLFFRLTPLFDDYFYVLGTAPTPGDIALCVCAAALYGLFVFAGAVICRLIVLKPRVFSDRE